MSLAACLLTAAPASASPLTYTPSSPGFDLARLPTLTDDLQTHRWDAHEVLAPTSIMAGFEVDASYDLDVAVCGPELTLKVRLPVGRPGAAEALNGR